MAEARVMALTTADVLEADGFTALYGAGELHEIGSLPPGVPFRVVVADEAMVASANPHAQPAKAKDSKPADDKPTAGTAKAGSRP